MTFIRVSIACLLLGSLVFSSCKPASSDETEEVKEKENIVQITTTGMDFEMADTIPSGWNTFVWDNNSPEAHFFLMEKYPEGRTIEDFKKSAAIFQDGMDLINQGKPEEGFAELGKLPEWGQEIVYYSGGGLISSESTSVTTIHLDPGYYIIECYVKMKTGVFHSAMGMAKGIVVTEEGSGNVPPEATVEVSISSTDGIEFSEPISKGEHIFSVSFKDQVVHEHFVGHDVNLARLANSANLDSLEMWMNWVNPNGLITPVPEGITFLGGVNDGPAGTKAYFEAELTPGKYAFVSEVPNARSKNMLRTFEVGE